MLSLQIFEAVTWTSDSNSATGFPRESLLFGKIDGEEKQGCTCSNHHRVLCDKITW